MLEILIQDNRALTDEERTVFFEELGRATYGLGSTVRFRIYMPELIDVGTVESAARLIASERDALVCLPREGLPYSSGIEIRVLWKRLLQLLFFVFPLALEKSSTMSKEYDAGAGGGGYDFDPLR